MENDSLVDYAKSQMEEKGLPIDAYSMVISDIANTSKEDIDKKINTLAGIVDKRVSEVKAKLTEVTKEEFEKMGYRERLELHNNNKELYERLVK